MKILLAGGIIDFYVNKEKYKKLKNKVKKFEYIYSELSKILEQNIGIILPKGIELRDLSITSNNFWGEDDFCIINDIGYCSNNQVELNENFITLRIFQIDIVALVNNDFCISDAFQDITGEGYNITISSAKVI